MVTTFFCIGCFFLGMGVAMHPQSRPMPKNEIEAVSLAGGAWIVALVLFTVGVVVHML